MMMMQAIVSYSLSTNIIMHTKQTRRLVLCPLNNAENKKEKKRILTKHR